MNRDTTAASLTMLTLLLLLLGPAISPAAAAAFPARIEVQGQALVLNGEGLCEWGIFGVDLYRAALYTEKRTSKPSEIIDEERTKRVELRFVRALTQKQMIEAYSVSFKANAGSAIDEYQDRLDQLTGALTAMKVGDRLTFDYSPKSGLEVLINGRKRASIEGRDFGRMFFRLYVGNKPPTEDLKKALLGLTRKRG